MNEMGELIEKADWVRSEDWQIHCPNCQQEHVKFNRVTMLDGNDNYDAHPNVRGDVIRLHGECEDCLPKFTLHFGFHKGRTYYWLETREEVE